MFLMQIRPSPRPGLGPAQAQAQPQPRPKPRPRPRPRSRLSPGPGPSPGRAQAQPRPNPGKTQAQPRPNPGPAQAKPRPSPAARCVGSRWVELHWDLGSARRQHRALLCLSTQRFEPPTPDMPRQARGIDPHTGRPILPFRTLKKLICRSMYRDLCFSMVSYVCLCISMCFYI